ncbi:hypothetical protein [Paraburkholderia sp. SIMBA_054]|uniref:hypothetical protein n=1 Tax=Paraburkholderia sp. SIMBA_054 TaxID=3085795 RepID=UPI003979DFE4
MLYQIVEYQRALLAPWAACAAEVTNALVGPDSALAHFPGAQCMAAASGLLWTFAKAYPKPAFGVTSVNLDGRVIPVIEEVALEGPFCRLRHFFHDTVGNCATTGPRERPVVLVCAPLAGHQRSCCMKSSNRFCWIMTCT